MKAREQSEAPVPDVGHRPDPADGSRVVPGAPMTPAGAVALQRLAGNHAVATALQREGDEAAAAAPDEAYADEEPQPRPFAG